MQKIAAKRIELEQERKSNGQYKKKERDAFLLWGEYPKGWQMIKDSILCIMLMNTLIGTVQKIDLSYYLAPRTVIYVQDHTIAPVKADTVSETPVTEVVKPNPKDDVKMLVSKIYQLESSSGTKGTDQGCHAKGLHNGYGYIPGSCYASDEAVSKLVTKWVESKQAQGLTTPQLLCVYNTGVKTEDCQYYKDYLNL